MITLEEARKKQGCEIYFCTEGGRRGKARIDQIYINGLASPSVSLQMRHSSCTTKLENLFNTQKELADYIAEREEKDFQERCRHITTTEDLVRFMYNHPISEITDQIARKVVIAKAKEFLGIDLDE